MVSSIEEKSRSGFFPMERENLLNKKAAWLDVIPPEI